MYFNAEHQPYLQATNTFCEKYEKLICVFIKPESSETRGSVCTFLLTNAQRRSHKSKNPLCIKYLRTELLLEAKCVQTFVQHEIPQ